jgi:hypothetical protein
MKIETTVTLRLLLIFAIAIMVVCLIPPPSPPSSLTTVSLEKIRIDSVYSKPRYEVMPELMWVYTTKEGSFTTNMEKYKIGDSIEVKIIRKLN